MEQFQLDLPTFWFLVLAFFWVGYFVLEGFDFGVGMLLGVLGRDNTDRRVLINTIGPHWDGNEVWLVVAGAGTFAAFPLWYATLFSSYFLPLLLIVVALVVRAVAFEYRGKHSSARWTANWDRAIMVCSLLPALLWGVALSGLLNGIPIDGDQQFAGNLLDLVQPYTLLGGLTTLSLCLLNGSVFLGMKTEDELRARARALSARIAPVVVVLVTAFTAWTAWGVEGAIIPNLLMLIAVTGAFGAMILTTGRQHEGWTFLVARPHDRVPHRQPVRAALSERHDLDARRGERHHRRGGRLRLLHADGDDDRRDPRVPDRPRLPGGELLRVPRPRRPRAVRGGRPGDQHRGGQDRDHGGRSAAVQGRLAPRVRSNPARPDRRLLQRARAVRTALMADAVLGVLGAVLVLAQATLLASIIARAWGGADLASLRGEIAALVAVVAARAALAWGFEVVGRRAAASVLSDLRMALVRRRLHDAPAALDGVQSGEVAAAAVGGVEALEAWFAKYLPQVVLACVSRSR